jgi:hypothetical protein
MSVITYTYIVSKVKLPWEQQAFLDELAALWPLAKGSLAEVRKPCIRANCQACKSGRKHKALIFSFRQEGKQRCLYVPAALEGTLRQAIGNGRTLQRRLAALGAELIERYRQGRR